MKEKSCSFIAGAFSLFHNKAGVTFDGSERRLQTCGGLTAQLFDSTSPASFMCVSFFLLSSRVVVSLCVVLVLAFLVVCFSPSFVSLCLYFCIFFFFHFF